MATRPPTSPDKPRHAIAIPTVRIQIPRFDVQRETMLLTARRSDIGAIVSFTGLCRDEAGRLAALELEHYAGMAEAEILAAAHHACARWPLTGLTAIHRHGIVTPGDVIVLVIAASSHRSTAFAGAEYMMDYLKTKAPFWKREHLLDGTIGGWVEAKGEDDAAAARWTQH
jgi:molybdopterin synthase catalytic subunit